MSQNVALLVSAKPADGAFQTKQQHLLADTRTGTGSRFPYNANSGITMLGQLLLLLSLRAETGGSEFGLAGQGHSTNWQVIGLGAIHSGWTTVPFVRHKICNWLHAWQGNCGHSHTRLYLSLVSTRTRARW